MYRPHSAEKADKTRAAQSFLDLSCPDKNIAYCVCVCVRISHSLMSNSVIPWTVAHQAPLSMGFSRQQHWSGLPFPTPEDLPHPGIESGSSALQADSLPFTPLQNGHIYYDCSPGEGHGNPLKYSCLENPMDRGAWRVQARGSESWTRQE